MPVSRYGTPTSSYDDSVRPRQRLRDHARLDSALRWQPGVRGSDLLLAPQPHAVAGLEVGKLTQQMADRVPCPAAQLEMRPGAVSRTSGTDHFSNPLHLHLVPRHPRIGLQ